MERLGELTPEESQDITRFSEYLGNSPDLNEVLTGDEYFARPITVVFQKFLRHENYDADLIRILDFAYIYGQSAFGTGQAQKYLKGGEFEVDWIIVEGQYDTTAEEYLSPELLDFLYNQALTKLSTAYYEFCTIFLEGKNVTDVSNVASATDVASNTFTENVAETQDVEVEGEWITEPSLDDIVQDDEWRNIYQEFLEESNLDPKDKLPYIEYLQDRSLSTDSVEELARKYVGTKAQEAEISLMWSTTIGGAISTARESNSPNFEALFEEMDRYAKKQLGYHWNSFIQFLEDNFANFRRANAGAESQLYTNDAGTVVGTIDATAEEPFVVTVDIGTAGPSKRTLTDGYMGSTGRLALSLNSMRALRELPDNSVLDAGFNRVTRTETGLYVNLTDIDSKNRKMWNSSRSTDPKIYYLSLLVQANFIPVFCEDTVDFAPYGFLAAALAALTTRYEQDPENATGWFKKVGDKSDRNYIVARSKAKLGGKAVPRDLFYVQVQTPQVANPEPFDTWRKLLRDLESDRAIRINDKWL
ncbi:MAG: hypothetical protein H0T78_05630 [Longispora sp.]|nr:hypothetical protein [Longispora sp. (in: high G+C Gram-positive bacteria)]